MALILAIESSCDETSVAITRDGKLLSNVINTQIEVHQKYGGVMPEIASRLHCENISLVLKEALEKADVKLEDIDAFAVTRGPGLIGALHVGMQCAKTLAMLYKKPLIPVHHLAGHIYANEYNEQLKTLVEKYNIGTIIQFGHNIVDLKQVYEMNHQIHKNSKYPIFIGLDHEGGMVRRIMNDITYLPGAMALGNASDEELYKIYNQVGKELRELGYNMNYMPSVDVNNNPYNPVINSRSYSDEPIMVAKKGSIAAKAMMDAKMLPTPKHFPGHGDTNVDSHLA